MLDADVMYLKMYGLSVPLVGMLASDKPSSKQYCDKANGFACEHAPTFIFKPAQILIYQKTVRACLQAKSLISQNDLPTQPVFAWSKQRPLESTLS